MRRFLLLGWIACLLCLPVALSGTAPDAWADDEKKPTAAEGGKAAVDEGEETPKVDAGATVEEKVTLQPSEVALG